MNSAWIGLIGTLLGGLLVGAITSVQKIFEMRGQRNLKILELKFQRNKEDWAFLRNKIEELHFLVIEFLAKVHEFTHFMSLDRRLPAEPAERAKGYGRFQKSH